MATLGALISSFSSLAIKLLPQTSSSSDEDHANEKELDKLMKTLKRIKATLHDAEEREIEDESVKLWVKELKQVAYSAEDVLDEYQYEVLRAEVESRGDSAESSRKRNRLELPNGLADRIKKIQSLFDGIAKDRVALQLREEDGPRLCINETQITTTGPLVVQNIFGREMEKEQLVDLLCSDRNNVDVVSVVSIVGMGGVGKTTLAQLVYSDRRIKKKFDLFGWICVSHDFNVERLTRDVVESITKESCGLNTLSALQDELKEKIKGKMIFLVVDDVWSEQIGPWEKFQSPFFSAKSTKVLSTTRNERVSVIMRTTKAIHLKCLSLDDSWNLFQKYAFDVVNRNNNKWMVEIGRKILMKCGGLPLAIKVIACLLRLEANKDSWEEILESELWECDHTREIYPPLQISYLRLPTYLKPCLLYCSMFPKDYEYDVEELVQLWAAQGYTEPKGRRGIEEIGRVYAKQLLERSLFEHHKYNTENLLCVVKLHDICHDLIRYNSQGECYSIEYGNSNFPELIYHVYVDDGGVKSFPYSSFGSLRTLIVGNRVKNILIDSDVSEIQSLRAVKLKSEYHGTEFPNSFGNLKHLRFISLQSFSLRKLPEYVRDLYNLRTLILSECHDIMEFLNGIESLVSLQFLSLSKCPVRMLPESICYLKHLKVLRVISCPLVELPQQIGNLANLEELVLEYCCITVLPVSFCQLKILRKLSIYGSGSFN
ncbi:hypothetical protein LUZ60_009079 [Juncus effusus]|nr:hypothetical protein LUZ60_009079 [Juncus effusus]